MAKLRIGLIGLGVMGSRYLDIAADCTEAGIVAIAGTSHPERLIQLAAQYDVQSFASVEALIDSGTCDAVLISSPHPSHCSLTKYAALRGLHVLVEKPIAVTVGEADEMVATCVHAGVQLGVVFQQRTMSVYQKAKELLDTNAIGRVYRTHLTATEWFRTQAYYDAAAWRGSWVGEGGGISMNQAPHVLDMLIWLAGRPSQVTAQVDTRWHQIETEDTIEAMFRTEDGASGYLYASTAEAPGQTRFEFFGEQGRLTIVDGVMELMRLEAPLPQTIATGEAWDTCSAHAESVNHAGSAQSYAAVMDQFARATRGEGPLTASGEDGRNAMEFANAILLSAERQTTVQLPLDRSAYETFLEEKRR